MNKDVVESFLAEFKVKLQIFDIIYRDDRMKNFNTLLVLDISSQKRKEVIQNLSVEDYSQGPLDDTLFGIASMWVFGVLVKKHEIYVKISLGNANRSVICISFHVAEYTMTYPFKKQTMKSPITDKEMKIAKELASITYRKYDFTVWYHFFICEDTGEKFTNEELDNINQIQVHNAYREKLGIPGVDEIKSIRAKYSLSASKMAEILGFGSNTYRLYEMGEVPSVANGRLILAIHEPEEFLKQIIASSHILSPSEFANLKERVQMLSRLDKANLWEKMFESKIFNDNSANEFTGYRKPCIDKVSQIISFFFEYLDLYKTKLNKLLFYADFLHYKKYGLSMTGLSYRAIQYGPVPAEYDKLYIKLQDDGKIEPVQVLFSDGCYGEKFKSIVHSETQLDAKELTILGTVVEKVGKMTSKEIADYSHLEAGWIQNEAQKNLISYQKYAFDLSI